MAVTRTVAIRIALEGYDEYRRAIGNINEQNRILASELRVIDNSYRNNAQSIDHLTDRQQTLEQIYQNEVNKLEALGDALIYARGKQEEYAQAVEDLQNKVNQGNYGKSVLEEQIASTKAEIEWYVQNGMEGSEAVKFLREQLDILNNSLKVQKEQLVDDNKALDQQQAYLNTATKEVNRLTIEYNEQGIAVNNATDNMLKNRQAMVDTTPVIEKIAEKIAILAEASQKAADMVSPIANLLKESSESAIKFESDFAGVEKTFPGTAEELNKLNKEIKDMSTRLPSTTTELAKVAENAGQLGVKAEDISDFTEVVVGLGNATNITSEQAGTLLAQFNNINNFTEGYGKEGYERFASTLVELGNNAATTESDIMQMSQKFASAGTLAGLTAPEILGMATALSSVGVRAEAGGTTLSKLTQNIQSAVETSNMSLEEFAKKNGMTTEKAKTQWENMRKPLEDFARVSGVSADEFAKKWGESPVEAINMFLAGLHETYEEGDSVLEILDDMGIKEIRLRNTIQALAASEKNLNYYVEMANNAWSENSALQTEVSKRYETTASKQQMLKNTIELIKVEIGEALLPVIATLSTTLRDIIVPISDWIDKNPELFQSIAVGVAVILGMNSALQGMLNLTNLVMGLIANPLPLAFLGAGAAIGALVYAIIKIKDSLGEAARSVEDFRTISEDTQVSIDKINKSYEEQVRVTEDTATKAQELVERLSELESQGLDSEEAQAEYNKTVSELNRLIPELNLRIDEETGKVEGGTAAVLKNIDAWKKSAIVRAYQEKYQKLIEKQIELEEEAEKLNTERKNLESKLASQRIQIAAKETEAKHILWEMQQNDIKGLSGANVELQERLQQIYDEDIPALERDINRTTQEIDNCTKAIEQNGKEQENVQTQLDETSNKMDEAANSANKIYKNVDDLLKEGKKNWGKEGEEVFDVMVKGMQYTIDTRKIDFDTFKERVKKAMDADGTGEWYMKGLMDGINRQRHKLIVTVEGVARSVNNKVRQTWQINSPSKVAEEDAVYLMRGYMLGMEEQKDNMTSVMEEIATDSTDAYKEAMEKADDSISRSGLLDFNDINTNIKSSVEIKQDRETNMLLNNMANIMKQYLPKISNMQVVMDGNKLVGQLAPKLDNYYVDQQMASERGI